MIAVVDGLKGFPEAITAVFPQTHVQTCIVHLTRYSLAFLRLKDRQALARTLKEINQAATVELAEKRLTEFEQSDWGPVLRISKIIASESSLNTDKAIFNANHSIPET